MDTYDASDTGIKRPCTRNPLNHEKPGVISPEEDEAISSCGIVALLALDPATDEIGEFLQESYPKIKTRKIQTTQGKPYFPPYPSFKVEGYAFEQIKGTRSDLLISGFLTEATVHAVKGGQTINNSTEVLNKMIPSLLTNICTLKKHSN